MNANARIKNLGLRGLAVADTKISYIDGKEGVLIYRGFRIEELAEKSSFVETVFLLLHGSLPNRKQLDDFNADLVSARTMPGFIQDSIPQWPEGADPMDVLQASVPVLAMADPELGDETREANVRRAVRLLAGIPAVMARWHRTRSGLKPLPPDENLSHTANFLWQLNGQKPDAETARDLDIALILHAEHTFNASTFACREVASTGAHLYAGAAAGVGALSGSLHGGANAQVMKVLLELTANGKSEADMTGWVEGQLARGERIMGMGHAIYKTFDPRAEILKRICRRQAEQAGRLDWYRLLSSMEEAAVREFEKRGKHGIKANVDFYSGLFYWLMGIPLDLMTPMFVMALAAGWCAHMIEEKFAEAQPRPALYRPRAEYIGTYCGPMGCVYQPIRERRSGDMGH